MSETRRTVSVEIVYDGDECGSSCPFLYDGYECRRFPKTVQITDDDPSDTYEAYPSVSGGRCDECKAEDPPTE